MDERLARSIDVGLSLVTVDLAIFTIRNETLMVLRIERGVEPFRGRSALPGGRVRKQETLDQGARRELLEETGIDGARPHLEQFEAFGPTQRVHRGRVGTVD